MEDVIKKCKFPECDRTAVSRGKRATGGSKRFAWCAFHKKGKGKPARREYAKSLGA